MKLAEVFIAVKEQNLTKSQLEAYHTELTSLFAQMNLEMAELEKEEAMFFLEKKEASDVATKRAWRGTKEGQRLIELVRYSKATEKVLSSLKSRLYSTL